MIRHAIKRTAALTRKQIYRYFSETLRTDLNESPVFPWKTQFSTFDIHDGFRDWFFRLTFFKMAYKSSQSDFLEGTKTAYRVTAESIFDYARKRLLDTSESEEKVSIKEEATLSELLDSTLASQIINSVNNFAQKFPDVDVVYDLDTKKMKAELLSSRQKGYHIQFGIIKNAEMFERYHPQAYECYTKISKKDNLNLEADVDLGGMEVTCFMKVTTNEVFYIKDRKTSKIIQGSEDRKVVDHLLILQSHNLIGNIEDRKFRENGEWKLIDLDLLSSVDLDALMNPDKSEVSNSL